MQLLCDRSPRRPSQAVPLEAHRYLQNVLDILLPFVRSFLLFLLYILFFSPPPVAIFLLSTANFLFFNVPPSLDDLPGQQRPPWSLFLPPLSSSTVLSSEASSAAATAGELLHLRNQLLTRDSFLYRRPGHFLPPLRFTASVKPTTPLSLLPSTTEPISQSSLIFSLFYQIATFSAWTRNLRYSGSWSDAKTLRHFRPPGPSFNLSLLLPCWRPPYRFLIPYGRQILFHFPPEARLAIANAGEQSPRSLQANPTFPTFIDALVLHLPTLRLGRL
jgi:hypothetical protein